MAIVVTWSSANAGDVVFDIDFGRATNVIERTGTGAFEGVLPDGLAENYVGWSKAFATAEVKTEKNRRYLRLVTDARSESATQFAVTTQLPMKGAYKVTVVSRTLGAVPFDVSVRLGPPSYQDVFRQLYTSENWSEQVHYFSMPVWVNEQPAFFFQTTPGVVDLLRIRVEAVSEKEMAVTSVRRPSASVRDYIRHPRFPLGLPGGWSFDRGCERTAFGADMSAAGADGVPVLKTVGPCSWKFYSEPFQTAFPGERHSVTFRYRGDATVEFFVYDDKRRMRANSPCAHEKYAPSSSWRTVRVPFVATPLSEAFVLSWQSDSKDAPFYLDDVHVLPPNVTQPPSVPIVALAPVCPSVGDESRVQFIDEPADVHWCVLGAPANAVLRIKVADLYGTDRIAETIPLKGGCREDGVVRIKLPNSRPIGQFRIRAAVGMDGKSISGNEEIVLTRVPRPRHWGADAPDSPFGCHANAWRPAVRSLKAAGVNWVRLHDTGEALSNWYYLEREKGKWVFRDEAIGEYRSAFVKVLAQLGTAPLWATHSADLKREKPGWSAGYYGRYLRPTNSVDWANYVTTFAKHYIGVIDEYFVWNEPGGRSWQFNEDAKWFAPGRAGQDFAVLQRQAYEALKRVNPAAKLFGFNAGGPREWVADVLDGGGFDCCDGIDWHYYSVPSLAHRDSGNVMDPYSLPVIREKWPDFGGKPLYMTEGQGTNDGGSKLNCHNSGLYRETIPWVPDTKEQYVELADNTARYIVQLLADGFKKVFLYTCGSYYPESCGHFQVLLGNDGYPVPSFVAHAALAWALEDRAFVRKANEGIRGCVFTFVGPSGETCVHSDLTKDEVLAHATRLPADVSLVDLFGNPVTAETFLPGTLVYEIRQNKQESQVNHPKGWKNQ